MIIVVGEILIDHFPEYERIGGAPFNFAYHLKNMGWPVQFITRVGDDPDGQKILGMLSDCGFDLDTVQVDSSHATGRVEVTLDDGGVPNFDICENAAYDHIDLSSSMPGNGIAVQMVYFGSLVQRTDEGFRRVQRFLNESSEAATGFCDINLRAPHINKDALEPSLRHADILKLNDEELEAICSICQGPTRREEAVGWLMKNFDISTVALTHGAEGSTAFSEHGAVHAPQLKIARVVDTVGAGDAFASVLAAGSLKGLPMGRVLEMAGAFAAEICGIPGAIPTERDIYDPLEQEFERTPNVE